MAFHKYSRTEKFPRNEHVEIHVREVTLNADARLENQIPFIEVREFLKEGEVYGHGIVIPRASARDLCAAFNKLGLFDQPSTGAR